MDDHTYIDEAARKLKVSQATAYKWRKRGLPAWARFEMLRLSTSDQQAAASKDAA